MAVLRKRKALGYPPFFFETPSRVYLEGAGCNINSLAPVAGDILRSLQTFSPAGAQPIGTRTWINDSAVTVDAATSGHIVDRTLYDNGLGICRLNYTCQNTPNRLIAGSYDPISSSSTSIYDTTGSRLDYITGFSSQTSGHPATLVSFFDDAAGRVYSLVHTYAPTGTLTGNTEQCGVARTVISTATRTFLTTMGNITTPTTSTKIQIILDTPLYTYITTRTSLANAAIGRAMYLLEKSTGNLLTRGSANSPSTTNGGPMTFESSAINVSGTQYKTYEAFHNAASGSTMFTFGVTTFDTNTPGTNQTYTAVTPTNTASIPGASATSNGWQIRTWAFVSGTDIFIGVISYPCRTGVTGDVNRQYLHVFKATTAAPDTITYVTSVWVNSALRLRGFMPVDTTMTKFLAIYSEQVEYWTWNLGLQTYVKQSTFTISPNSVTVDSLGRLWILENTTNNIHLMSLTISNDITVAFQNTNIEYAGTNINTNLIVNSYNFEGSRVVSNVTLQLDTASASFSGGALTTTVNTSSTGDTLVPITITGAGYIRVIANLT